MKIEKASFYTAIKRGKDGKIVKVLKQGVVFTYSGLKIYAYNRANRLTTHFIDELTGLSFDTVMYYLPEAVKHISRNRVNMIKQFRATNDTKYQKAITAFNEMEIDTGIEDE